MPASDSNEMLNVIGVCTRDGFNYNDPGSGPHLSNLLSQYIDIITTEDGKFPELSEVIQIQLEVIPAFGCETNNCNNYHSCTVTSIKARIKPTVPEFDVSQEKDLDYIINGTESTTVVKIRKKKRVAKIKKQEEQDRLMNRFSGLDV